MKSKKHERPSEVESAVTTIVNLCEKGASIEDIKPILKMALALCTANAILRKTLGVSVKHD